MDANAFSPSFFLQLILAVGSAAAVYGAIRADLNNLSRSLDEERRLREQHERDDDKTHHDIRGDVTAVSLRLGRVEGRE